jgi:hypothetical protein
MSTYQPKPNTWTLFPNKYKKDETHPEGGGVSTCPKCGSPQKSPKLDGTTARIWFTCGSYGYADKPDQVFRSSDKCLDREEINTLQRKVEELQVELDFANEAVDQRERSRKDAETELRNVKAAGDYWHSKWKEACENARIKHKEVCELKRERNRLIDGLQASTIHSCGASGPAASGPRHSSQVTRHSP